MPTLPAFRSFRLSANPGPDELGRVFSQAMQSVGDSLRLLLGNQRARTSLLTSVAVTVAGVRISHGLALQFGRTPAGWCVVDKTANADVWRTAWDSDTITLQSTAPVTISLEVF